MTLICLKSSTKTLNKIIYSYTQGKDIWYFILGQKFLSYHCYLSQAAKNVRCTLIVLELVHMAVNTLTLPVPKFQRCFILSTMERHMQNSVQESRSLRDVKAYSK